MRVGFESITFVIMYSIVKGKYICFALLLLGMIFPFITFRTPTAYDDLNILYIE